MLQETQISFEFNLYVLKQKLNLNLFHFKFSLEMSWPESQLYFVRRQRNRQRIGQKLALQNRFHKR